MRCSKKTCLVVGGGALAAAGVMAIRRKRQTPMVNPNVWEKMRKGMEEMPKDLPPRILFDNVEATRDNTTRILEILERSMLERDSGPIAS